MKLYNTLSRKIEEFKPQNPEEVKIYTCGPTVYGYQHIGNYASYVYWDFLLRTLIANNYKPKRILNLTDVGHLSSDADEGEDKLEKGARREGKTVWEIAEFYANDFLNNFRALNLLEPAKITKATDYIEPDKEIVTKLIDGGFTYETEDGIYFDTAKLPTYADFAHLDLENLKAGARVEYSVEKHNPSDFAVWKFIKPGEKHDMQWQFLDRPGYPGWHLECSTIIHQELQEPIDIHTGGIDHIPVHHTNEIAQTKAAFGTDLSRFWLHCNFITIDGQKISKSLGNIYTLQDLAEHGFEPMDYKMWVLQGHYQSERNFTFDDLTAAKNRRLNWRNRIAMLLQGQAVEPTADFKKQILEQVNDNLNSAGAFAIIDNNELSLNDWNFVDELFGLNLIKDSPDVTPEQKTLLEDRATARGNKDWAKSDELRARLEAQGITTKDTPEGQFWQYL